MLQDKECSGVNVEEVVTREVVRQGGVKVLEVLDFEGFLNADDVSRDRMNYQIEGKLMAIARKFVRGYRTEGDIYYEVEVEGFRILHRWETFSCVDSFGFDLVLFVELPTMGSYLVKHSRNWKNCAENRAKFKGMTVCSAGLCLK